MSQRKLLIVVDDNVNFAVRVWRYLTGPMEYGFTRSPLSEFERIAPDDSFKLYWFGPKREQALNASTPLIETFLAKCTDPNRETWCVLDKRGLRGRNRSYPTWFTYYQAFVERFGEKADRIWVMSSYGDLRWASTPSVRPKTVESLEALRNEMKLSFGQAVSEAREEREFNVLVTGAGFELADGQNRCGVSVGFPDTATLLNTTMRFLGQKPAKSSHDFPVPFDAEAISTLARKKDLDAWCDAVLSTRAQLKPTKEAGFDELEFREAFRRSLLEHDFGHQRQSLIAAQLGWDYWLTTNYSRFADRAIDDVASSRREARPWRAITTSIEADAVAPELAGSRTKDFAENNRILVKLHGDVGHVWTMAVAGQDKKSDSKLDVRPQLHRMYAAAEAMLLSSLWARHARARQPTLCRWSIVGHGLRDEALVRLIATVIQRSPSDLSHEIVHVTGSRLSNDGSDESRRRRREEQIMSTFRAAFGERYAAELFNTREEVQWLRVGFPCPEGSALEYMARLSSLCDRAEHVALKSDVQDLTRVDREEDESPTGSEGD